MRRQRPESPLVLREKTPLRLTRGRGGAIRAVSGTVWVTAEGLGDDVFLAAGDVFRIDTNGLVLVEAIGFASVSVLAAASRPSAFVLDIAGQLAAKTVDRCSG